jgi:transcriptional regulator with XRE-family HTH domain
MASPMAAKLQGSIGKRIKLAYESRGLTRAEFVRQLQPHLPKVSYVQVTKWEKDTLPKAKQLAAIAHVTRYEVEDFLSGLGIAHPALMSSDQATARARDTVLRFLQVGTHAPFTDDEVKFLELCATESSISDGRLEVALLGFRAARLADDGASDRAVDDALDRLNDSVRKLRSASTSSFPPPKPESTKPARGRRPRGH